MPRPVGTVVMHPFVEVINGRLGIVPKPTGDMRQQSRSDAQQAAEYEVRALLSRELGVELIPRRIDLENGSYVMVDE